MPRVPSPAAEFVGAQIRAARGNRMTQDELAVGSEIDSANVRAYEAGRAMPNLHSLIRLSTALGVNPGALIDGLTPEMFLTKQNDGRLRAHRGRERGSAA